MCSSRDEFVLEHVLHISDYHVQHELSHQVRILRVVRLINCLVGHHGLVILQALPHIPDDRHTICVSILDGLLLLGNFNAYSLRLGGNIAILNHNFLSILIFYVLKLLVNRPWQTR